MNAIATVSDYPALIIALRARAAALKIALSSDENAALAGLPDRYLASLFSPAYLTSSSRTARHLGVSSLGPVLGLLGLKMVLVEDEEAINQFGHRIVRMKEGDVRSGAVIHVFSRKFLRENGAKGAVKANKIRRRKKALRQKWRERYKMLKERGETEIRQTVANG